jgi:DNA polymerase III delta subunit
MTQKSEQIKKPHIFLFAGEDDYTSAQKVRQWVDAFMKKYNVAGVTHLDAEEDKEKILGKIKDLLGATGLFSSIQLVVLKNVFQLPADLMAKVAETLDSVNPETFVIFFEKKSVKKNLKLYKKLATLEKKQIAKVYHFSIPGGRDLDSFIKNYSHRHNFQIEPQAVETLAVFMGRDLGERVKTSAGYETRQVYSLWQVVNELDKLATYKKGKTIISDDVRSLVESRVSENIFALTESLGAKNIAGARKLLDELLDGNQLNSTDLKSKAIGILGALAFQFRSLLQLLSAQQHESSTYGLAQTLGWHSFRVQANMKLLRYFSGDELEEVMRKLLDIDRKLKSSSLPPKVLLSQFISVVKE